MTKKDPLTLIYSRFAPTRPPTHWSGVFSATSYGSVCPQTFPQTSNATEALLSMSRRRLEYLRNTKTRLTKQAEDCLNLNIYLPHNTSNKKRGNRYLLYFLIHFSKLKMFLIRGDLHQICHVVMLVIRIDNILQIF